METTCAACGTAIEPCPHCAAGLLCVVCRRVVEAEKRIQSLVDGGVPTDQIVAAATEAGLPVRHFVLAAAGADALVEAWYVVRTYAGSVLVAESDRKAITATVEANQSEAIAAAETQDDNEGTQYR